jgi:pyruvate formate lyase activating enzyme
LGRSLGRKKDVKLSVSGVVFNIQRFSIHDGPGIRTTVFLKGCSLRCFWCHNPEGIRPKPEIQFFPSRCIGCGACAVACAGNAHIFQNGTHLYVREYCEACGQCVETCYAGGLELTGSVMGVDQVMVEVLADRAFYENSGGGVTLSGGEPLLQQGFSRAVLERCKGEGLHTAIETTANFDWQRLAELLPLIDLVMMDIKHMDPEKHRAATGGSNERILENAQRLMRTEVPVVFRVPVVPTVNDSLQEIGAIGAFVRHLTELRLESHARSSSDPALPCLELLAFHRLAADKYRSLGLDYQASRLEAPSKTQMDQLKAHARSYGIEVLD